MAQLGYGFGGQLHLLRYLGWHREMLDGQVCRLLRAKSIRWHDQGFGSHPEEPDAEAAGLDFLPAHAAARHSWHSIWPSEIHRVAWDAVGEIAGPRSSEWILIEAYAHFGELQANCEAKSWRDGLSQIADALARTQNALGVPMEADWLRGYYPHARRLAALNYLLSQGEKARLITVCFVGDRGDARRRCPQSARDWEEALAARDRHLQLPARHALAGHLHHLILDVCPKITQAPYTLRRKEGVGELIHEV
jgi:hypothetical protein